MSRLDPSSDDPVECLCGIPPVISETVSLQRSRSGRVRQRLYEESSVCFFPAWGRQAFLPTGDYRTRLADKRLRETATEFCVVVLILGQVSQTCAFGKDLSPLKRGLPGLDRSVPVYRVAFPPPDRKTVRSGLPSTYADIAFDSLSVRLRQVAITLASSAASRGCGR